MRTTALLAATVLMLAACSSASSSPPAGDSTGESGASPSEAGPTATDPPDASSEPGPSQAQPSGGTAVADDCEEELRPAATDAQNTLVLTWERIGYHVTDDATWQSEVAGGFIDPAAYRQALGTASEVPDSADPGIVNGEWSQHIEKAGELATLLEQAAASGTPFADGIGQQILDVAFDLQLNAMFDLYGAVEALCYDPADDMSAAGVDEIVAILAPPNATETDRITSPSFSTFEYLSTDSIESLRSHYEGAFADAGWDIFWTDTYREAGTYWDINLPDGGRLMVSVNPAETGSGTTVEIDLYGP